VEWADGAAAGLVVAVAAADFHMLPLLLVAASWPISAQNYPYCRCFETAVAAEAEKSCRETAAAVAAAVVAGIVVEISSLPAVAVAATVAVDGTGCCCTPFLLVLVPAAAAPRKENTE